MDCISLRHLSPSLGFLARWSTWAERRLRMVRAGCLDPNDSLKYCSRNLPAWSLTQIFAFSLVWLWVGVAVTGVVAVSADSGVEADLTHRLG